MITLNSTANFKVTAKTPENLNSVKQSPNNQHTKIQHITAADKQAEGYTVSLGHIDADIKPSRIIVDGDTPLKDLVGKSYIASWDDTPRLNDLRTLSKMDLGDKYAKYASDTYLPTFLSRGVDSALVVLRSKNNISFLG